ncbi:serine hydrolase [Consotaella aegiceratis]|uniref:serine hydrolase n=1 Tax=Consotaella aegiceratis TaxID=3097961 RepID=UPI002F42F343
MRTLLLILALGAILQLATTSAGAAQLSKQREALDALLHSDSLDPNHFAPVFLDKVAPADIERIIADMERKGGALLAIDPDGDGFLLRFERAEVRASIALSDDGRISGLWFGVLTPTGDFESLVSAITSLPGDTSLLVLADGEPLAQHRAGTPMAVGSAFKLAVLVAVERAVEAGRLDWGRTVDLSASWKSLPTGQLQDWPDGSPLTVSTLSHLMMSLSDNTAADALIHLVGREAVEAVSPRNSPFLTTREAFVLKARSNTDLRARWHGADAGGRRAILEEIADLPLPALGDLIAAPTLGIEWQMTARELCRLLDATADLPSLGINAGPIEHGAWRHLAYKGGSEIGVFNLSSRVVGRDGTTYCSVATWNAEKLLEENTLLTLYRGLLARLQDR